MAILETCSDAEAKIDVKWTHLEVSDIFFKSKNYNKTQHAVQLTIRE